jgi:hypothetical protein
MTHRYCAPNIPMNAEDVTRRLRPREVNAVNVEMALTILIWQQPTDRALAGWAPFSTAHALADLGDGALMGWLTSSCQPQTPDPGGLFR